MTSYRKPNLFMVGAPKCGTTALYTYLSQHDEIYMSPRKEPQFFGADFDKRPLNSYQHIADEASYLALFTGVKHEKVIGEASTSYFYSTTAAQEIYAFNPQAKIIIMLRQPIEMMYSLYYQQLELGIETLPTFEAALAAESARLRGTQLAKRVYIPQSVCYRYIASYARHVGRYLDIFGREKVHIILFDDFIADTMQVYKDALQYLGLDSDNRAGFAIVNPNSQPRNTLIRDFLRNPPEIILMLGKLVLPVARPVYRYLNQLNTQPRQRPPINPDTAARLSAELQLEIQELSQLLGRDLSQWCQPPSNRHSGGNFKP